MSTRNLLIQERPLIVLPSLVQKFNGNYTKAIVLQQIHFLTTIPRSGVDHEGHHWVWFTYNEFIDEYTPWLSERSLRRTITELEEEGYIVSTSRIKDNWDNTKYYRIEYEDTGGRFDAAIGGRIGEAVNGRFLYTETSSEISSEIDDDFAKVTSYLDTNGVMGGEIMFDRYKDLVDEHGADVVLAGMRKAQELGKLNVYKYVLRCIDTEANTRKKKVKPPAYTFTEEEQYFLKEMGF
jgi:hypothetical protein